MKHGCPKLVATVGLCSQADKRIRYNFLEKQALKEHAVREFVFASGNMSGQDMASALELALPKMQRLSRKLKPPFVAAIDRLVSLFFSGDQPPNGMHRVRGTPWAGKALSADTGPYDSLDTRGIRAAGD